MLAARMDRPTEDTAGPGQTYARVSGWVDFTTLQPDAVARRHRCQ